MIDTDVTLEMKLIVRQNAYTYAHAHTQNRDMNSLWGK
jgi:hypothetical protein